MANSSNPFGFKLYEQNSGISPRLEYATLGGTVSIGDALIWASGVLTICANPAATGSIVGIAEANGVSGDRIPYTPVSQEQTWIVQMTTYTEATHRGNAYGIAGATGVQYIDAADATHTKVRVLGLVPPPHAGYETGTYAVVRVAFLDLGYGSTNIT